MKPERVKILNQFKMIPARPSQYLLTILASIFISKTKCSGEELSAFKWAGLGNCGDSLASFEATADVLCAINCIRNSNCAGFSYDQEPSNGQMKVTGRCNLHRTFHSPDLSGSINCFVPLTYSFPRQPITTSTTVPSTEMSPGSAVMQGSITTSAVTTSFTTTAVSPATIITTVSTTASPSTLTATVSPTTSALTTASPTTSSQSTALPTSKVPSTTTTTDPGDVMNPAPLTGTTSKASNNLSPCASNGGIVGMYEKKPGDEYYLLCKPGPNPFQAGNPIKVCKMAHPEDCYTKCGENQIYLGFYRQSEKNYGPCAPITSASPRRRDDDCHTVLANTQVNIDSSEYVQWMFCGDGDDLSKYYSVVDVVLEKAPDTAGKRYILKQIVCCQIK